MSKYSMYLGMDLGDKYNHCVLLDTEGNELRRFRVRCRTGELQKLFTELSDTLIAIEACTHSPWISRLAEGAGHTVLVGNPRKTRIIYDTEYKDDFRDAELLARLARFEPRLLHPIHHRGEQAQLDLMSIKARHALVTQRTKLINCVRGLLKSFDVRLASCSADSFHKQARETIPEPMRAAIYPLLEMLEKTTDTIRKYDKQLEAIARQRYEAETAILRSVPGVGPLTSMAFILTIEDPGRIQRSRDVGAYVGLVPKRDQSGEVDKQLRITKAGDKYLRHLLVNAAQYILGAFGADTALRRWGLKLAQRGGKNAKKRAVVAVARKLAVLLHHLWITGSMFEPFPNQEFDVI